MLIYCVFNKHIGLVGVSENRNRAERLSFALDKKAGDVVHYVETRALLEENDVRQLEETFNIK